MTKAYKSSRFTYLRYSDDLIAIRLSINPNRRSASWVQASPQYRNQ